MDPPTTAFTEAAADRAASKGRGMKLNTSASGRNRHLVHRWHGFSQGWPVRNRAALPRSYRASLPAPPAQKSVQDCPPHRTGSHRLVTMAHLITYQHRFCGLLRLIRAYFTFSCRAGSKLASNSRTAMRLFINAMGTGCYILLLINSVWPSMLHSLGHPRKVAGGVLASENGSNCWIGVSFPPFCTVHAPDVPALW